MKNCLEQCKGIATSSSLFHSLDLSLTLCLILSLALQQLNLSKHMLWLSECVCLWEKERFSMLRKGFGCVKHIVTEREREKREWEREIDRQIARERERESESLRVYVFEDEVKMTRFLIPKQSPPCSVYQQLRQKIQFKHLL